MHRESLPESLPERPAPGNAWSDLHARLHRTLRQRKLLEPMARLLVAVSGGQDSLCLIKLLIDLQLLWQWELAIVHCNHGWREDATANADWVANLAQAWQLPFFLETAASPPGSEAAARAWRYECFTRLAEEHYYAYVLTAHTQSDRAETLLYNLIRGSGTDGLQALTWRRPLSTQVQLVRPLLEFSRQETIQFCQRQHLSVWEDETNRSLDHARNRIRLELIPYLQTHFNPQVEQALAQTAELLRADIEYLEAVTDVLRKRAELPAESPQQRAVIDRLLLRTAPPALQRRVIRQILQQVLPCTPSYQHIEKLLFLFHAPNKSRTDPFPGGIIATVSHDRIYLLDQRSSTDRPDQSSEQ